MKIEFSDAAVDTSITWVLGRNWKNAVNWSCSSVFLVFLCPTTSHQYHFCYRKQNPMCGTGKNKRLQNSPTISLIFQQPFPILYKSGTWETKLSETLPQKIQGQDWKIKLLEEGADWGERKKRKDEWPVALHSIRWCYPAPNAAFTSQAACFVFELINNTFQSQDSGWLWSATLPPHSGRWCLLLIRACSPLMWHWGASGSEPVCVWMCEVNRMY